MLFVVLSALTFGLVVGFCVGRLVKTNNTDTGLTADSVPKKKKKASVTHKTDSRHDVLNKLYVKELEVV